MSLDSILTFADSKYWEISQLFPSWYSMYNGVLNFSSDSMLLLKLAKGRQTDRSKRLLWVQRGAEVASNSLRFLPSTSSMAEAMQETEPWRILSMSFCTSFLHGKLGSCRQCCVCLECLDMYGYVWILRIGMPRVHDPSYRRCAKQITKSVGFAEFQCASSSV